MRGYVKGNIEISVGLSLLLGLLILAGGANAVTNISSCTNITAPGVYVLQNDIINSSSQKCIGIQASDVTFDGAGYMIDGQDLGSPTYQQGVYVYNSTTALTNVTVKNLIATDWYFGINYQDAQNGSIENNTATSNTYGIYLYSSSSNTLTNNTATSNTQHGIYLYSSSSNTLTNNTASSNSVVGIQLYFFTYNNTISNNTASSNGIGIGLYSGNNTVTNNTAKENNQYDIYVGGNSLTYCNNLIANNTGSGNRPIRFYNTSVTLANETLSELILCNADNSGLTNITIEGSATLDNNGLFVYYTDSSTFTSINSSNNYYGFYLKYSDGNTITNSTANSNSLDGIYLSYSDSNTIANNTNTISGNGGDGIYSYGSYNNTIENNILDLNGDDGISLMGEGSGHIVRNNTITNTTGDGIFIDEDDDGDVYDITLKDNTVVNSTRGVYITGCCNYIYNITINNNTIRDASDNGIDVDDSYIYDITIAENTITDSGNGVYVLYSGPNTLTGNNISNIANSGIYLYYSSGNNISNNTITYYCTGINIFGSSFNDVLNNTIMHSTCGWDGNGISVYGGGEFSSNTFQRNTIGWNYHGIDLSWEDNNLVEGNTFTDNSYGAYITRSWNNSIYNNYFRNTINAYEGFTTQSPNHWNTTYHEGTNIVGGQCLGGNYWDDYQGEDIEADGIGNTLLPYNSNGNITPDGDWLPLLMPPAIFNNTEYVRNGTTVTVMETGCPFDVRINATANDTGSTPMGVVGRTSSDGESFGVFEINSSSSGVEKGVKYLWVTNTTGLDNITRIRIELHYTDAEIAGLDEGSLALFYWDPTTMKWLNTMNFIGTNMTPTGPYVFDAGRNTGQNYVYAEVDHFSVYGVGGNFQTPPKPQPSGGGGGGFGALPPGADVLIVANSIDIGLAEDFLDFLRQNNIDTTIVNATEFTEAKKVENRQIIILGGPDAPEGIGEIVSELLDDDEEFEVRQPGSQTLNLKINVWTGRYVYKQRVLIIAGSDRTNTQMTIATSLEEVKQQLLLY